MAKNTVYARNNYMFDQNYAMPDRQYDITRQWNFNVTLPLAVPYRLDATDYVFFNYPSNFPAHEYQVVIESMSNASSDPMDRFRNIGPLTRKCELPGVYFSRSFGSQAKIGVLPVNNPNLDKYIGNLYRGNTYTLDVNAPLATPQGHRALQRTGVI
jgi:hypothetical protein